MDVVQFRSSSSNILTPINISIVYTRISINTFPISGSQNGNKFSEYYKDNR